MESFTAKVEDGLTSFPILDVLRCFRSKDLPIYFITIMSEEISVIHCQHTEM